MNSASVGQRAVSPSTSIEVPLTPVASALQSLHKAQFHTYELLGALESKLDLVLQPVPPATATAKVGDPVSGMSPLHEELLCRTNMADSINGSINDLLARLTV